MADLMTPENMERMKMPNIPPDRSKVHKWPYNAACASADHSSWRVIWPTNMDSRKTQKMGRKVRAKQEMALLQPALAASTPNAGGFLCERCRLRRTLPTVSNAIEPQPPVPFPHPRFKRRCLGQVGKDLAVDKPTVQDMHEALKLLGLRHALEPYKFMPRDPDSKWNNPGRIRVEILLGSGKQVREESCAREGGRA